jgi:hypothetical protein
MYIVATTTQNGDETDSGEAQPANAPQAYRGTVSCPQTLQLKNGCRRGGSSCVRRRPLFVGDVCPAKGRSPMEWSETATDREVGPNYGEPVYQPRGWQRRLEADRLVAQEGERKQNVAT